MNQYAVTSVVGREESQWPEEMSREQKARYARIQ